MPPNSTPGMDVAMYKRDLTANHYNGSQSFELIGHASKVVFILAPLVVLIMPTLKIYLAAF